LLDPNRGPTEEVGGENSHSLLDVNGRFGAHLQAIEVKNLFGFLDPSFDSLATIVFAEPGRLIFGHRGMAKVSQSAVFELFFTGMKAFQPHSERIGTMVQLEGGPGDHLSVLAHLWPGGFEFNFLLQSLNDFVVMQFGVQFIAHFDQQRDIVIRTKTRIDPKTDFARGEVVRVPLLKALQAVLSASDCTTVTLEINPVRIVLNGMLITGNQSGVKQGSGIQLSSGENQVEWFI
jgi:hypothetical protein